MPFPAQTDRKTIVETARTLIEQDGIEQLSLTRLAAVLGIKAPSLYRHLPSKTALLQAVVTLTIHQLFDAYRAALAPADLAPTAQMLAILRTHRAFAHANPQTYVLAFTTSAPEERADDDLLEQLVLPLQRLMAELSGAAQSLAALRGALALVHGFVLLELNQQLRRGGDLDAAFEAASTAYLVGWQQLRRADAAAS
jgi:AcrR family transcriptional regulator